MSLFKLETPVYPLTLPLSKEKINYRPFLVKEELAFVTAIELGDRDQLIETFFQLAKNCVVSEFNVDEMYLIDFIYLIVNIRCKSKQENLELVKTCDECEKEFKFSINLVESLFLENEAESNKIVDVNEDLVISVRPLKADFFKIFLSTDDDNSKVIRTIANSIDKIHYKGEVFVDFSEEDVINDVISMMTKKELEKISEAVTDLVNLKSRMETKCEFCGNEEETIVTEFFDFLE